MESSRLYGKDTAGSDGERATHVLHALESLDRRPRVLERTEQRVNFNCSGFFEHQRIVARRLHGGRCASPSS